MPQAHLIRYPIVEIDHGGAVRAALLRRSAGRRCWSCGCCSRAALVVLFAIDLEHQILPDVITLPGIVVGLAGSAFPAPGAVSALPGRWSAAACCG